MYIDLKKTLEEISRCLPEKGAPTQKQLQRMYELTLRLQSQELAVIYDMEAFGSPAAQEPRTLAQQHSGGENRNGIVTLKIDEPLPSMKKLTEAVEEHWKAMIHAAISDAAAQEPLPYFAKAFVEIEIVTPRGSDNARVWDTSNRAIQVMELLQAIYYQGMTERQFAKKKSIHYMTIHNRKVSILHKLKKILENEKTWCKSDSHRLRE